MQHHFYDQLILDEASLEEVCVYGQLILDEVSMEEEQVSYLREHRGISEVSEYSKVEAEEYYRAYSPCSILMFCHYLSFFEVEVCDARLHPRRKMELRP